MSWKAFSDILMGSFKELHLQTCQKAGLSRFYIATDIKLNIIIYKPT